MIPPDYEKHRPRPDLQPGDLVTTTYDPRNASQKRVVKTVEPSPVHSQTGWFVETECGLVLDSAWFTKIEPPYRS